MGSADAVRANAEMGRTSEAFMVAVVDVNVAVEAGW